MSEKNTKVTRKRIKKLHQTDGKVEDYQPTTLDQIWGDKGIGGKYNTLDEAEYTSFLNEMNKSDLQAHAAKVGVMPRESRDRLTKMLLKEFRLHVASYRRPKQLTKPKGLSKKAAKILAEGR